MKRLVLALLILVASPLAAAVTTINNGNGTTTLRMSYTVSTASTAEIRDDICRGFAYQATIPCTQAMVTAGSCTSGQLGQLVTNPETCIQAIDRVIRQLLLDLRKRGDVEQADQASVKPVRDADQSADILP